MTQQYGWPELIRKIQDTRQMSQQAIASELGMSQAAISHIFTGRRNPSKRTKRELIRLATGRGIDVLKYEIKP